MPQDGDANEDDRDDSLLRALLDAHVGHKDDLTDVETSHAEREQQVHRLYMAVTTRRDFIVNYCVSALCHVNREGIRPPRRRASSYHATSHARGVRWGQGTNSTASASSPVRDGIVALLAADHDALTRGNI